MRTLGIMANRGFPQPITIGEARRHLSGILRSFRENSTSAVPVVFGPRRRPEAVVVPFAQFEALLSIVEDRAIAPLVAERIAAGGGRPFDEMLDELGMSELAASRPLDSE
jgi:hypothetical protein